MNQVKKAALHNLGCKVNAYETEAMEQMLIDEGYEIVPFEDEADVYVINTCSVTHIADRKSRQMIRRAREKNPDAIVVACGCYVQTAHDAGTLPEDLGCDIIIGNDRKHELVELLDKLTVAGSRSGIRRRTAKCPSTRTPDTLASSDSKTPDNSDTLAIFDINNGVPEYEELPVFTPHEHTRAFIKVQDGCNQFCSYCIIPYARGRVRSRSLDSVIAETKRLAADGFKEIVITGIHVGSYSWSPTAVDPDTTRNARQSADPCSTSSTADSKTLIDLIEAMAKVDGIQRIRLSSVEPRIITEDNAKRLAAIEKLCPHFHLSLQSGCDATLSRMNRKYTADEYRRAVDILRAHFDNPAITTDVIVGFPGETDEDFKSSYDFVKSIGFYELHVFKYSKRSGTRAAKMPDQVSSQDKKNRSDALIALGEEMSKAYRDAHIGKRLSVLIEEDITIKGQKFWTGFSKEYIRVNIPYDAEISPSQIIDVVYE